MFMFNNMFIINMLICNMFIHSSVDGHLGFFHVLAVVLQ